MRKRKAIKKIRELVADIDQTQSNMLADFRRFAGDMIRELKAVNERLDRIESQIEDRNRKSEQRYFSIDASLQRIEKGNHEQEQ